MRWWQWATTIAAAVAAAASTQFLAQTSAPELPSESRKEAHNTGSIVSGTPDEQFQESTNHLPLKSSFLGHDHMEQPPPPDWHRGEHAPFPDIPDGMPPARHGSYKSIYSDPGHTEHPPPPSHWFDGMERAVRSRLPGSTPELQCSTPGDNGCVALHAALDWSRVEFDGHSPFKDAVNSMRSPRAPMVVRTIMISLQ